MFQHSHSRVAARRFLRSIPLALGLLAVGACQTSPEGDSTALPAAPVRSPQASSEQTVPYVVQSDLSEVRFLVYRAGALARLGHNHVIQASKVQGEIHRARDIHQSSFSLRLPVADFTVDVERARREEGEEFSPLPDAEAIAGTTKNMLGEKVLDATRYPTIEIDSLAIGGPAWGPDISIRIRLHGVERELTVPTVIEDDGNQVIVSAQFSVNQSDFGITPLSVLGGAVQVANSVRVRMRLVALRA